MTVLAPADTSSACSVIIARGKEGLDCVLR